MKEGVRGERRLQLTLVTELIGQPVQSLIEPIPTGGTGRLNVPVPVAQRVQAQLVCDFGCIHGIGEVLVGGARWHGCHESSGRLGTLPTPDL